MNQFRVYMHVYARTVSKLVPVCEVLFNPRKHETLLTTA